MNDWAHVSGEDLGDLLDGRLDEARHDDIAGHLAQCTRCRRELDALKAAIERARGLPSDLAAPPELVRRVRNALDAEDVRHAKAGGRRDSPVAGRAGAPGISRRQWIAGGLAAAAGVILAVRLRVRPDVPARVAEDFVDYSSHRAPLDFTSTSPADVSAYFVRSGIAFETRVFDLGMMQFTLVGGSANEIGGRPSALFAYLGPGGTDLVCQMYVGTTTDLPPANFSRTNDGITFAVHQVGKLTLVFWQEGAVVCVLTSDAPTETVLRLATAKAMKVPVRA